MPTSGLIPSLPVTESFAAAYLEYYRILPLDLVDGRLRVAASGEPNAEALADLGRSYDAELDLIQVEGEELSDRGIQAAVNVHTAIVGAVLTGGAAIELGAGGGTAALGIARAAPI